MHLLWLWVGVISHEQVVGTPSANIDVHIASLVYVDYIINQSGVFVFLTV